MKRRDFLRGAAVIPLITVAGNSIGKTTSYWGSITESEGYKKLEATEVEYLSRGFSEYKNNEIIEGLIGRFIK